MDMRVLFEGCVISSILFIRVPFIYFILFLIYLSMDKPATSPLSLQRISRTCAMCGRFLNFLISSPKNSQYTRVYSSAYMHLHQTSNFCDTLIHCHLSECLYNRILKKVNTLEESFRIGQMPVNMSMLSNVPDQDAFTSTH